MQQLLREQTQDVLPPRLPWTSVRSVRSVIGGTRFHSLQNRGALLCNSMFSSLPKKSVLLPSCWSHVLLHGSSWPQPCVILLPRAPGCRDWRPSLPFSISKHSLETWLKHLLFLKVEPELINTRSQRQRHKCARDSGSFHFGCLTSVSHSCFLCPS